MRGMVSEVSPDDGRLGEVASWRIAAIGGWHWRCDEEQIVLQRRKAFDFLLIVMDGAITINSEAGQARLGRGDFLLVGAGVSHDGRLAPGCDLVEACTVHADVADQHGLPCLAGSLPITGHLHGGVSDLDRVRAAQSLRMRDPQAGHHLMTTLLRQIITDLASRHGLRPRPAGDPRLLQAQQLIARHLADDPGIDAIAASCGCSSVRLRQLFQTACGCTISAWRDRLRLRQAGHLLRDPQRSIESVARACGYADARCLRRALQRGLGLSPAAYRRSVLATFR